MSIQKYAEELAVYKAQHEMTNQELLEQQDQIELRNIVNGMFNHRGPSVQKKPNGLTRNIFHYNTETMKKNNQAASRTIFKLEHPF